MVLYRQLCMITALKMKQVKDVCVCMRAHAYIRQMSGTGDIFGFLNIVSNCFLQGTLNSQNTKITEHEILIIL